MGRRLAVLSCLLVLMLPQIATANDLTRAIQQELLALGYDPGATDGKMTTQTAIAISTFQAEQGLEVTGEPTPELAGILKAVRKGRYKPAPAPTKSTAKAATPADSTVSAESEMDLEARQQACLQEKMEAAQNRQKKKRGFGRLMRAAGRVSRRFGVGEELTELTRDVYGANATAEDLAGAAEDLGLTEDEVEKCRNPPVKEEKK